MRFLILVKADAESEAGVLPGEEVLAAMGKYNEELVKAGVLLAGEGLHPSAKGARVRFRGSGRTVVEGPFPANGELVSGFWLIQAKSREEAVEWVKRAPMPGEGEEIEIRPLYEPTDIAPGAAEEHHARHRAHAARP